MSLKELSKQYEHYETPDWAGKAILKKELLPQFVLDPCCGTGVLTEAARDNGYTVCPIDIHDWGFQTFALCDFLKIHISTLPFPMGEDWCADFAVFMNPPFSKACEFVEKSFDLGARKIVCFQRFAWWESRARREFWQNFPPSRVYVCGDRATCWRHDIPEEKRANGTTTAHAWFVWEKDAPAGTLLSHIWRDK